MKLIIAGCRHFNSYEFVQSKVDHILKNTTEQVVIIQGGQKGVDYLAARYAQDRGLPCLEYKADWDKYGGYAGPIRNRQMAKIATHCIVFDSEGPGSRSMIKEAKDAGLELRVIKIKPTII